MVDYEEMWQLPPYSLNAEEKRVFLSAHLKRLTEHHYQQCAEYRRIVDGLGIPLEPV